MEGKGYSEYLKLLEDENKDKALLFILNLLDNGTKLEDVYEEYLIPSLLNYDCENENEEICIWKEHTRTSIVRTILEATYSYLIKEKKKDNGLSIVVLCPQEEYHEIGALIATNYFSLAGFKAKYIGANTPSNDIISAVKVMSPNYVAISVTDYYNLVVTKRLTAEIRKLYPDVKIIIGGQAFNHKNALEQVTYDYLLQTKDDIFSFGKEVSK